MAVWGSDTEMLSEDRILHLVSSKEAGGIVRRRVWGQHSKTTTALIERF